MSLNPYDSSAYIPPKPDAKRVHYWRSFTFIFQSPNWSMNLLWGSLALFLNNLVVPGIVLGGYYAELIEDLHRARSDATYKDFDTNRIMDYLSRGVWPFLVNLIMGSLIGFLTIPLTILGMIGFIAAVNSEEALVVVLTVAGLFAAFHVFVMVCNLFMWPMLIRTDLSQSLGEAFRFGWIVDFVLKMWWEMVLGSIVFALAGMMAFVIGGLLFCVGFFPLMTIVAYAGTHFSWQLYEVYLDRGGQPVPLKTPPGSLAVEAVPVATDPLPPKPPETGGDESTQSFN